jgi:hypothetical protein
METICSALALVALFEGFTGLGRAFLETRLGY